MEVANEGSSMAECQITTNFNFAFRVIKFVQRSILLCRRLSESPCSSIMSVGINVNVYHQSVVVLTHNDRVSRARIPKH